MSPHQFKNSYFPELRQRIWLASCSIAPSSTVLDRYLNAMLQNLTGEALPWHHFEEKVTELRRGIATLINARSEQIALMPNASVCAYQIISTANCQTLLYNNDEFPSIANVWQAYHGIAVEYGTTEYIRQRLTSLHKPELISIPAVSYLSGKRLPIEEITALSQQHGVKIAIDAYQMLGIEALDVAALNCDFLFGGFMKYMLGQPGLAFVYVKDPEQLSNPRLTGWFGRKNPFDFDAHHLDYATDASKLETGTLAIPSVFAACAALEKFQKLPVSAVGDYIQKLLSYLAVKLLAQGEQLYEYVEGEKHGAHLAIIDETPVRLAAFLQERGIVTSPRKKVLRIAIHYFIHQADVDFFVSSY
ncbi:aminotransferase class V-fold PLP-dependent enzyme [Photobacterium leiognathi]|uniref:aminotransferase class V-fold PLP-dependent enzyme n=1 Tax=Photobacterium leiognathi TaxID=553611 RepID=UPI00273A2987|nr:aminotransferase class V-fold PLP-dependent enzyme [Photobacterium leiognathi]